MQEPPGISRVFELRKALEEAPSPDPDLACELIDAQLGEGDRAGAIETYRRFAQADPHALRTHDRLREAYERALWSVPQALATNLPIPRTRLVGRHEESAELAQLLVQRHQVVLLGPAGIGKTRLALEAGQRAVARYPQGVWWCDFTSAADQDDLRETIASVLKLDPVPGDMDTLCSSIVNGRMLLIFDRCEVVADAVAQLAQRLRERCDGTDVVMTSRAPIDGVDAVHIAQLSLPPQGKLSRSEAFSSDAVRLFVERAVDADPSFVASSENAELIAHICQRVQGSPFGIEIAAGYLAHGRLRELAKRIEDRGLPEVSLAARAAVEWAYALLAGSDSQLLRSVSIFPRYWTIDDASAVLGADAAAGVRRLLSMSLVIADRAESDLTRYSLLDATRNYAYERLCERGELPAVQRSFIARVTQVVQAREPHSQAQALHLALNFNAALRLCQESPELVQPALALCAALGTGAARIMVLPSSFNAVEGLIEQARRMHLEDSSAFTGALATYAWLANFTGRHALANDLHEVIIASARRGGNHAALARALARALPPLLNARRYDDAMLLATEALEQGRAACDIAACADALRGLSAVQYFHKRYDEAKQYYDLFTQLPQDRIPPMTVALMLSGFSAIMMRTGDVARACAAVERALAIAYDVHDYAAAAHGEKNLAHYLITAGELAKGHEALQRAVSLSQVAANRMTQLDALEDLVAASLRSDQLETIAFVLGYVDAGRKQVQFRSEPAQQTRAAQIRRVVQARLGEKSYEAAHARGELATLPEIFAAVSRLRVGETRIEEADRFSALTPREREVAQLAAQGRTNREIAQALVLSVRTVDAHMATIFRKLGIESREQIIR